MVAVTSKMLELGTKAPDFELQNYNSKVDQKIIRLGDYQKQAILVSFICNHCPYVILIEKALSQIANDFVIQGGVSIAINSNDIERYPADAPDKMSQFANENQFSFPYCFDETQLVAKAYKAACTPDFYLFDEEHRLVYRGQFDGARPGNGIEVTGKDLKNAINALASNEPIEPQIPSMGCSIKWKS